MTENQCKFQILTEFRSVNGGVNNLTLYKVVNERFQTLSVHKTKKLAEKRLKRLCKQK